METRDFDVTTPDGRTLSCHEGGAPEGFPVVIHWGTPMGRSLYQAHVTEAEREGVRLISFDRAGYGGSTPSPMRSVADVASDTLAVLDALDIDKFASWGISGGGPHVLACAALLPDRVTAIASLASVAPWKAEGLDWYAGMGQDNVEEFGLAAQGREALEPFIKDATKSVLASSAGALFEEMATLLSGPDAEAMASDVGAFLDANSRAAIAPQGGEGWIEDDLAFTRPWGFELEDIRVPVLLWQGVHDLMVPPDHGRWLAERIPGVDARISSDDGHLTLITARVPETHRWLLEHSGAT
jgi:pimeloyl-ACP methyl ester carboxylesterase